MTAPTLLTERLVLRHLTHSNKHITQWLNDPEVVRFSDQRHRRHKVHEATMWVWSQTWCWAIEDAASGIHIGNISALMDVPNRVCEVAILIGEKEFWGQGIGSEAWKHVCDWILSDDTTVRKIEAGCMATNTAMKRIMQKTGMLFEGERRAHFLHDGVPVGMLQYARFK